MNDTKTRGAAWRSGNKPSAASRFIRGVLLGAVLYLGIQAFLGWP